MYNWTTLYTHPDIVQLTLNHLFHNILTTTSKFLSNEIVGLLRDCCWIPKLPLIYVKIGTYWQNMYNVLSVVVHLNQTNNTPLTTNPKNHSNHTKSTFLYHSFVSIVKHLNLRPPIQKIAHGLLTYINIGLHVVSQFQRSINNNRDITTTSINN